MSEQVVVNLKIHNRTYKIKVDPSQEALVRQTAEQINAQIVSFQEQFRGRDMQDYLAMTLIARMTQASEHTPNVDVSDLLLEINQITQLIS